ncbi:MAG: 1-acyl-sn-glycerol-3-phosphate acyltransferase [Anaerolineaceae bacterium]|nr:MAG: 1-acyl-sn-glycerol-3-phosphate acyltransferase [Anaerolineaceae bacterium]
MEISNQSLPTHSQAKITVMFIRFFRWLSKAAFTLLSTRKIEGLENIPSQGPYILVANHLSRVDGPLLLTFIKHNNVTGWAAAKYRSHPLFGLVVRLGGGIFIQRGKVDRDALTAGVSWLREGNIFGLAPEGTRSKTGALIRAKVGAAYLADITKAPILPIAIMGTESFMRNLLRLRRSHLIVRIGAPFHLPPIPENERSKGLRRNTDEIMCRIAAMMTPNYHGAYADHPRLGELLSEIDA